MDEHILLDLPQVCGLGKSGNFIIKEVIFLINVQKHLLFSIFATFFIHSNIVMPSLPYIFFLPSYYLLSSLPSPFFLGLEHHNGINLSVWRELVLVKSCMLGLFIQVLMLCLFPQRQLEFVSSRWRTDPVTFFEESKSRMMQIYFITHEKFLVSWD